MTMREDMVEALWAALKEQCCSDPANAKKCVMVGRDNLASALEAMGRVVVPREPTEAMIGEGHGAALMAPSGLASIEAIYRAMLAAASPLPAQGRG